MSFEKLKARALGLEGRILEDELYRLVWEEIERGEMDNAAQARAIAEAGSNEGMIRAAYIRHRVRRLKDELDFLSRDNLRPAPKVPEKSAKSRAPRSTCSLCDAKLGFFNTGNSSLCKNCLRNVTTINRPLK